MKAATQTVEVSTTEQEDKGRRQRGAHPQPLDWSGVLAQQGYVFGVDMSGDGERVVLSDLRGNILGRDACTIQEGQSRQPEETVRRALDLMRGLFEKEKVKPREVLRIGVGFGGPVDARRGTVMRAHDVPTWEDFPLAERFEKQFDVPTLLDNDARLAALGEMWFGAGVNGSTRNMVYVHWSTGVGGGIIVDGRLLRGATTTAGEVGHTTVRTGEDALPCRCGGRGHLEAYVRESALVERARALVGDQADEDIASLFSKAEQTPELKSLIDGAVDMLAVSIGNLITSANPSSVVIGGRVARAGSHLIPEIGERARRYAMPVTAGGVDVVLAALGGESAVMGAVALGLDSLR